MKYKFGDRVLVIGLECLGSGQVGTVKTTWKDSGKVEVLLDTWKYSMPFHVKDIRKVTKLDKALR